MPIYEYRCSSCQQISEKICRSDQSTIDCPNCGAEAARIVSLFSSQTESTGNATTGCLPGSGFT